LTGAGIDADAGHGLRKAGAAFAGLQVHGKERDEMEAIDRLDAT
jgi:hypothetical protein